MKPIVINIEFLMQNWIQQIKIINKIYRILIYSVIIVNYKLNILYIVMSEQNN